jgi:hypothetical protein
MERTDEPRLAESGMIPSLLEPLEPRLLLSSVFFMHQSVGQGILDDHGNQPGLRAQLEADGHQVGDFCLYDFGQGGSQPTDIAAIFADTNHDGHYGDALAATPALAGGRTADVLMFKSCFTAVDYLADDAGAAVLDSWKQAYIDDVAPYALEHPQQKIVALPMAPTRKGRPYLDAAAIARAREWSQWLAGTFISQYCPAGNVFSFNLFDLLADPASDPTNANMLREEYWSPVGDPHDPDCHPNDVGYGVVADQLRQFIENTVLLSGTGLFVAPGGDDAGDGSWAHPFAHVQHALDLAQPGQTVYLRGGTYHEYLTFGTSGQAGRPITLAGYPGEPAVLSGTGLNYRYAVSLGTCHDITIRDLSIRDYIADGIRGYGVGGEGGNDGLSLRNLDIGGVGEVVKLQASSPAVSHNVLIEGVSGHDYDSAGFNIGPAGSVDGVTIRNVTLVGPGGGDDTAIDGISVEHGQNIAIENAVVSGHPGDGIDLKADHVAVRRVTVTGQARNGIKLWGVDTLLENSITMNNGLNSLVLAGTGPYTLANNLIGNTTGYDYSAMLGDVDPTISIVANSNIWVSTAGQTGTLIYAIAGATFAGDNNIYWCPNRSDSVFEWAGHGTYSSADVANGAWAAASGMDGHGLYADPMLGAGFHPLAGSPAIDRAATGPAVDRDGEARPVGLGYDVGPFETAGSGPDVLAPTADLAAGNITTPGGLTRDLTVTLADNVAVDVSSLDDDDLVVTGPQGGVVPAHFVGVDTGTDGTPRVATYRIHAPGLAWNSPDNGHYTVSLAAGEVGDTTGNVVAGGELGGFDVSIASDVLGRFGTVAARRGVTLRLTDPDGTAATFSMSGAGNGEVVSTDAGWDLNFLGTNRTSNATLATRKGRTPGDDGKVTLRNVRADGSMLGLTARTADLAGVLDVAGGLATLALANVAQGGRIGIHIDGQVALEAATATIGITLGNVDGASIDTADVGIKSLTVAGWTDTDPAADIIAPWIGTIVAGSFDAGLTLSGTNVPRGKATLGSARLTGSVAGATWAIDGDVGPITIAGTVTGWLLAGAADGDADKLRNVKSLVLGDVQSAQVQADGAVGAVRALRWAAGTIAAGSLASLTVSGRRPARAVAEVLGDFGAAVTLHGQNVLPGRLAMGPATIAHDLIGSVWNVSGSMSTLTVTRTAGNSQVWSSGRIAGVTLGASDGSDFLAGVKPESFGKDPAQIAAGDLVLDPLAKLASVRIQGWAVGRDDPIPPFLNDSNFLAPSLGTVSLLNGQAGTWKLYAQAGQTDPKITRVSHKDSRGPMEPLKNWTWLPGKAAPAGSVGTMVGIL